MKRLTTATRLLLSSPAGLLYALFFLAPLVVMLRYSLATSENLRITLVWTLDNYVTFFENPFYGSLLLRSLLIAGLVATVAVLIGYPTAWVIARAHERWRNIFVMLLIITIATNAQTQQEQLDPLDLLLSATQLSALAYSAKITQINLVAVVQSV